MPAAASAARAGPDAMRDRMSASVWQPKAPGLMRVVELEFDDSGTLRDVTTERNPDAVETPESIHCADLIDAVGKRLRAGSTLADQLVALGHTRDLLADLAAHERTAGHQVRELNRKRRMVKPILTSVV
jgi:hypothetical protein